jgi:TatD DNase family protein
MKIDIHSHDFRVIPDQIKVLSLQFRPRTDLLALLDSVAPALVVSAGIHPWNASEWASANIPLPLLSLRSSRISFFGEIGLDNSCGVDFDDQQFVFEQQLMLANEMGKSVLIHNVGHQAEVLALKRRYVRIPAWILHGYRGKPQGVDQYVRNGFYISFGANHQPDALRACPLDRLLLESDESDVTMNNLYPIVSEELGLMPQQLEAQLTSNFNTVCRK